MRVKKSTGIALFIIGIVIIGLSYYTSGVVSGKVASANQKAEMMTDNPVTRQGGPATDMAGGMVRNEVRSAANRKALPYDTAVFWGYILGGCLIVIGGGIFAFSSKRK